MIKVVSCNDTQTGFDILPGLKAEVPRGENDG